MQIPSLLSSYVFYLSQEAVHRGPSRSARTTSSSYEILVAELENFVEVFDQERRHLRRTVGVHEDLDARY